MKILCPTDFSEGSKRAIELACYLADICEASIVFISVFQEPRSTGRLGSIRSIIQKNTEEDLAEFLNKITSVNNMKSEWSMQVIGGHAADIIVRYAEKRDCDLIIMGTQGSSSLSNIIIGSTAQYVLNNSNRTIIVVPDEEYQLESMKNSLIMLDNKLVKEDTLEPFKFLLEKMNAKTTLYHLSEDPELVAFDPMINMYLKDYVKDAVIEYGDDPVESVKNFVQSNKIGLVAMLRRKHTWWERIFMQSHTDIGVFTLNTPLMVLPCH
jgi:nucleotide-binding universal stress UspA family protein